MELATVQECPGIWEHPGTLRNAFRSQAWVSIGWSEAGKVGPEAPTLLPELNPGRK